MDSEKVIKRDGEYVLHTYGRNPIVLEKGHGLYAEGPEGQKYLDFTSGIGVNSLGYCDMTWAEAVSEQAHKLQHASNLYYTAPCGKLAKKLCKRTGMSKVFFGRHGTLNGENELALELLGDAHHVLIRALAFSGHDGGMEFKADDFEQHVGDARMRAVQQRDRAARASLPLNPENGRTFAGKRLGKGLMDGGVKHLGNPEPGHRARTQFDEISSGKSHSCLLDKGMLIRWIARNAAQRAL